jgi:DNA-binding response OmpR family regulator
MHLRNTPSGERAAILLVEDEYLLRDMLEEALAEAGFAVLSAASGEEAAALLGRIATPWALVTDVNLGRARMDGWELARLVRQQDPNRGILYVSGDSAHRWKANGVPRSILLSKPFAPASRLCPDFCKSDEREPFAAS